MPRVDFSSNPPPPPVRSFSAREVAATINRFFAINRPGAPTDGIIYRRGLDATQEAQQPLAVVGLGRPLGGEGGVCR